MSRHALSSRTYDLRLHRHQSFNAEASYIFPNLLEIYSVLLVFLFQLFKAPLWRHLILILLLLPSVFCIRLRLFIDWIVCQMNKCFLQGLRLGRVRLSCKSNESILEYICFERFKTCHKHINPQVVLITSQQMRLVDVLRNQVSSMLPVFDLIFLSDNFDSFSTRGRCRFENVHVLVVWHLAVVHPAFVVVWQDVRRWTDVEVFALFATLSLAVAPQVWLWADAPSTCEVVDPLALVHVPQFLRSDQRRPEHIPRQWAFPKLNVVESRSLQRINHTIVRVRLLWDAELQPLARLELVLSDDLNFVFLIGPLHLQECRIAKEYNRRSSWNRTVAQNDCVARRSIEVRVLPLTLEACIHF